MTDKPGGQQGYSPPDVSREVVPVLLDRLATEQPDAVLVTYSTGAGPVPVTRKQYTNAVDNVAYWLEKELGKGDKSEGLAYFGSGGGDVRYGIVMLAAVKAGFYVSAAWTRSVRNEHVR